MFIHTFWGACPRLIASMYILIRQVGLPLDSISNDQALKWLHSLEMETGGTLDLDTPGGIARDEVGDVDDDESCHIYPTH